MRRRPGFLVLAALPLLALAVGGAVWGLRGATGGAAPPAASAPTPPPVPARAAALPPPAPQLPAAGPGVILRPSTTQPGYFWRVETVDEWPMHISLALDGQAYPHIAYQAFREGLGYSLRYAHFDGSFSETALGTGHWLTETVDNDYLTGIMPSLALDSAGRPRIAYRIGGDYGDLRYAYHDGSTWHIETADAQGDTGGFASLALDAQDRPHVSYDNGAGCLLYARFGVLLAAEGYYAQEGKEILNHSVINLSHPDDCEDCPIYALERAGLDPQNAGTMAVFEFNPANDLQFLDACPSPLLGKR